MLLSYFYSSIFPQECEICETTFCIKNQNYVCEDCLSSIYKTDFVYCHSCGKITANCLDCKMEKKFDDIGVFTKTNKTLTTIIGIYKLKSVKALAKDIADLIKYDITDFVKKNEINLITYVPLSKKLYKKRGFNHLREILINIFPKSMVREVLVKTKDTKLQMELSKEEREKNLKNVFKVKKFSEIEGKNILIFDDIMTTGSTLLECLKEIRKGKPNKVYGYVIGR